jgi:hypothetical protein
VISTETIITEQRMNGILKSNIVTMLSLNTVPKWRLACPARRSRCDYVNPGVIIGWISDQGSGELIKKVSGGLSYYTGTTGFISVTDVVSISYELMNSTIKK